MTITHQQVKLLMKNLQKNTQEVAAAKSGMDVKTARKYIKEGKLPLELQQPRKHKTQPDSFKEVWPELASLLNNNPGLEAKSLLEFLMTKYQDQFHPGQLRTLQRRVRVWRASYGKLKPIVFRQEIKPGKQSQSDFTCMNSLKVIIGGNCFDHLLFHFMLPFSRWESVYLCFSESFHSLTLGFEKAVWELGGVLPEHRTDNLSAATKAMGSHREFTESWSEFMKHYATQPTTNNPGVSHENGSVEKSHDLLKKAIDQALMLRGDRGFDTQENYMFFVEGVVKSRNKFCQKALSLELKKLRELPDRKWNSPIIVRATVSSSSVIQLLSQPYTVPSRLIHYTLRAYIYTDEIILFYGDKKLQQMPRSYGDKLKGINYRHVIDSLLRKPGAFANYRYQGAMFPRLCFRQAYDALLIKRPGTADKQYLKLLQLAKIHSEQQVAEALELLLEENQLPTNEAIKELIDTYKYERRLVNVAAPDLTQYDSLLTGEVQYEV